MATRLEHWNTSFEAVKSFVNANNRYPSTTSQNIAEKTLAQWWSRQRHMLTKHLENQHTTLKIDQVDALQRFLLDNQNRGRDGVWNDRYNKLVNYFKINNKLFSYKSDNADELKIMRWWNQQKTFARKFNENPQQPVGGFTQDRFDKTVALMRLVGDELPSLAASDSHNAG